MPSQFPGSWSSLVHASPGVSIEQCGGVIHISFLRITALEEMLFAIYLPITSLIVIIHFHCKTSRIIVKYVIYLPNRKINARVLRCDRTNKGKLNLHLSTLISTPKLLLLCLVVCGIYLILWLGVMFLCIGKVFLRKQNILIRGSEI